MQTKFNVGDFIWLQAKVQEIKVDSEGLKYSVRPTKARLVNGWGSPLLNIDENELAEEAEEQSGQGNESENQAT